MPTFSLLLFQDVLHRLDYMSPPHPSHIASGECNPRSLSSTSSTRTRPSVLVLILPNCFPHLGPPLVCGWREQGASADMRLPCGRGGSGSSWITPTCTSAGRLRCGHPSCTLSFISGPSLCPPRSLPTTHALIASHSQLAFPRLLTFRPQSFFFIYVCSNTKSAASGHQAHIGPIFYLELALSLYFMPAACGQGEVATQCKNTL
jgi:hypothetical protein